MYKHPLSTFFLVNTCADTNTKKYFRKFMNYVVPFHKKQATPTFFQNFKIFNFCNSFIYRTVWGHMGALILGGEDGVTWVGVHTHPCIG